eukprot:CAMPEP_0178915210 /NCGR_PEP_ID=MMETSP0786-20121207/11891_1 /TAXON_ID=186022 /ORGANISM="Thalassionema frauenfeldii, Strain CCMP 1798" /LENGTH=335 /DNA_ID=CAMNT_0020588277 /DNA_START=72 /DNA_END=1076 /DNA_ORIENTATION=+
MFSSFYNSSRRCIPLVTPFLAASATRVALTTACDEGVTQKDVVDEAKQPPSETTTTPTTTSTKETTTTTTTTKEKEEELLYHGMFPQRQLWKPVKEYPLWDSNWDHRQPTPLEDKKEERQRTRLIRKEGVTRHIILVRHGQYDESSSDDEKRILTKLGREQADLTGQRLQALLKGGGDDDDEQQQQDDDSTKFDACNIKILRVSDLTRAKETADLIAQHLSPEVKIAEPDPLLNEGTPAHTIPSPRPVSSNRIAKWDDHHARIEEAFQKYMHRQEYHHQAEEEEAVAETNDKDDEDTTTTKSSSSNKHEYEIIVCHANVIRYFVCRALQLPPEAW